MPPRATCPFHAASTSNPHPSSRPVLLVLGLLLAPSAWAQTDLIALHPCAILDVKDKQQVGDLQTTCATELARDDVRFIPSDQVQAFLDKEAKGSCARTKKPAECLGKLATATQASRAVLITVSSGQLTRVSGLVVNPQGEVVDQKSIQRRTRTQETQAESARTAITLLRQQLNLIPLKNPPPVEQPPPPPLVATPGPSPTPEPTPSTERAESPPPTPAPPTPAPPTPAPPTPAPPEALAVRQQAPGTERTWKTQAAYASAGTGAAVLGLSLFLAIDGNNAMLRSNEYYANNQLPVRSELAQISQFRQEAATKRTLAGVSAALGAALAGTGVYLWLQDRPAPGAAALSVGPGGLSLHGVLP